MFNNPGSKFTLVEWLTFVSWLWLFVSALAGVVTLAQYLYNHLRWI